MTEPKFTTGPWKAGKLHFQGNEYPSVSIGRFYIEISTKNGEADADLIAAAPDLYSTLSGLINGLCSTDEEGLFAYSDLYTTSVNALAKARGEHDRAS